MIPMTNRRQAAPASALPGQAAPAAAEQTGPVTTPTTTATAAAKQPSAGVAAVGNAIQRAAGASPATATPTTSPAAGPTTATATAKGQGDQGFVSEIETMYNTILGQQKKEWQNQKFLLQRQNAIAQARAANSAARMGGGMGAAYQGGMRQATLNTQAAINQGKASYMAQRRDTMMNQLADVLKEKETLRGREWAKGDQADQRAYDSERDMGAAILASGDDKMIKAYMDHLKGGGTASDFVYDDGSGKGNYWEGLDRSKDWGRNAGTKWINKDMTKTVESLISDGINLAGKGGTLSADEVAALRAYAYHSYERHGKWPSAQEIRDRINYVTGG